MALRLLQAPDPDVAIVPLEQAKAQCRVTFDDDDELIEAFIAAAVEDLDGPDGQLSRALLAQRWALDLDAFPRQSRPWGCGGSERPDRHAEAIELPLTPIISIDAVKYVDEDGVQQTLDPAAYLAFPGDPGFLEPAPGLCWPATRRQGRAVSIEFTAGYGSAAEDVPQRIRAAIRLMAADLYENREAQTVGPSLVRIENPTVESLLFRLIFKPA